MTSEADMLPLRFLRFLVIGALVSLTVVALWACALMVADLAQSTSSDGWGMVIGLVVLVLDLPVILLAISTMRRLGQVFADGRRRGLLQASLVAGVLMLIGYGTATPSIILVGVVMLGLCATVARQHRPVAAEAIAG